MSPSFSLSICSTLSEGVVMSNSGSWYSSLSLWTNTCTTVDSLCCLWSVGLVTIESGDASVTSMLTSVEFCGSLPALWAWESMEEGRVLQDPPLLRRIMLPRFGLVSSAIAGWRVWLVVTIFLFGAGGDCDTSSFSTASWCLRKKL